MSQPETIETSRTPSTPHAVVRSQDAVVLPLGPKHKGMRMCARGLLKNASAWLPRDRTGERWTLEQLSEHLTELGRRFYAGDVLVVDEFLQLYALDSDRQNHAVEHRPTGQGGSDEASK